MLKSRPESGSLAFCYFGPWELGATETSSLIALLPSALCSLSAMKLLNLISLASWSRFFLLELVWDFIYLYLSILFWNRCWNDVPAAPRASACLNLIWGLKMILSKYVPLRSSLLSMLLMRLRACEFTFLVFREASGDFAARKCFTMSALAELSIYTL